MTVVVRALVLVLLAAGTWRVYWTREQLVYRPPDPEAVAAIARRLSSIGLDVDGRYVGRLDPEPEEVVARSGADCHVAVDYQEVGGSGPRYRLYVGAALRLKRYFHRPRECLPSRGAELLEDEGVPFDAFATGNEEPRMRRLVFRTGERDLLVYFWFQAGAHVSDHSWATSRFRFEDLMAGRPYRPTYIITLFVEVRSTLDEADRAGRDFLRAMGPELRRVLVGEHSDGEA